MACRSPVRIIWWLADKHLKENENLFTEIMVKGFLLLQSTYYIAGISKFNNVKIEDTNDYKKIYNIIKETEVGY